MSQLKCSSVSLGYNGNKIISDLNFSVSKGDYLCIVGDNGSGKTTLMKSILGLLKPMDGEIVWGDGVAQKEIGYLTQQSEAQKEFPASVKEVVYSGLQSPSVFKPFYNKRDKEIANGIMERLGILHLKKRCYRELSGGQQQRVLLARALCSTQKILFLDEPVTGLDPESTKEMYELIYSLNKDSGVTIIMISHDIEPSLKYSSHILRIGQNPFFGASDEYINKFYGNHQKDFLVSSRDRLEVKDV